MQIPMFDYRKMLRKRLDEALVEFRRKKITIFKLNISKPAPSSESITTAMDTLESDCGNLQDVKQEKSVIGKISFI